MPDRTVRLPVPMVTVDELRLAADDVLFLAVKSQDTGNLLGQLAVVPTDGDAGSLPVFCAQNGVANEDAVVRHFDRVYGVCVNIPATHLEPGVVEAPATPVSGILQLGRYPAGADVLASSVAADLRRSGFLAEVRTDVMAWKRATLLSNLVNALQVLCVGGQETTTLPALSCRGCAPRPGRASRQPAGPLPTPRSSGRRPARSRWRRSMARSAAAGQPGRASSAGCRPWRPTISTARSSASGGCTACRRRSTPPSRPPCARSSGGRARPARSIPETSSRPNSTGWGRPSAFRVAGIRLPHRLQLLDNARHARALRPRAVARTRPPRCPDRRPLPRRTPLWRTPDPCTP